MIDTGLGTARTHPSASDVYHSHHAVGRYRRAPRRCARIAHARNARAEDHASALAKARSSASALLARTVWRYRQDVRAFAGVPP